MNKHILTVIDHQMNPEKYTKEQLEDNRKAAYAAYRDNRKSGAAYRTAYRAAATYTTTTYYWLNKYFIQSDESKQDYVDAINKDNE